MPGRITHHIPWEELREFMNLAMDDPPEGWSLRYNLAPNQLAPIIRADRDTNDRFLAMARWGLATRRSRDAERGPINARIESVSKKPTFRDAFHKRRCIVPATGYYEWQMVTPGKPRVPWYFTPVGTPVFAFAGLWEAQPDTGLTCCICTTEPNALVHPIHHRMGVILAPAQIDEWLSNAPLRFDPAKPYPPEFMKIHRVSRRVRNPENDDPTVIEPV